jgi:hypothetical protein
MNLLPFGFLRRRGLDRCLLPLVLRSCAPRPVGPVHVLLCVADHFEPQWGGPPAALATQRVRNWTTQYPDLFDAFRDSDGRPPRHTFFFPIDQYDDQHVAALAGLCRRGFGEVEIHLHHDHDTADNLRRTLENYKLIFAERHGLLSRRRGSGEIAYGFVHGNWALNNSRPDGRWCGVDNELNVLRETGCYADFTFPSAPDPTQPRKINSIYYSRDCDSGVDVGAARAAADSLMLIHGPLLLDWRRKRIENGCLQSTQAPSMRRLDNWLRARIRVSSRPDWLFVKLHTHGATEGNQAVLLGEAMVEFHRALKRRAETNHEFCFHYVTAREMYNLAKAAEAGYSGSVAGALDYELTFNCAADSLAAAG